MSTKKSTPSSSPITPYDAESAQKQRFSRQLTTPSVTRPRGSTITFSPNLTKDAVASGAVGSFKKKAYGLLSKKPENVFDDSSPPGRRIVSMPPPPSSSIQAQIDIDNDRRARGIGSPPIIDFTRFEDTYRGPRSGTFEGLVAGTKTGARSKSGGNMKPALKRNLPTSSLAQKPVAGTAPHPASARKPDPRLILSSLEDILGDSVNVEGYLDSHELLAMHQLDQLDFEERDRVRASLIANGKLEVRSRSEKGVLAVFGENLRKSSIYASANIVLSNREHEIPIVVVNTIEELYRTGIYQSNLFRNLPNRDRLMELINIYDTEKQLPGTVIRSRQPFAHKIIPNSGFGSMTSLHLESTPDICALLTTYLSSLREPVLSPCLFMAIWDWCCVEDEETETTHRQESFGPRLSSIPLARTYTSPNESMHVTIAQLLLHLLPSSNFSLLVYILAFFSQVTLVREENGVGVDDLARMYGGRLFGGDSLPSTTGEESNAEKMTNTMQTRREGETMMRWFLRRWAPISDGLFDVVDDAKMGIFRRTLARRDSFGKDILPSWPLKEGGSKADVDPQDMPNSSPLRRAGSNGSSSEGSHYDENLHMSWTEPPAHSTPRIGSRTITSAKDTLKSTSINDEDDAGDDADDFIILSPASSDVPDETLDITVLPTRSDSCSASSTMALDERLMDLSMSNLLNQSLPPSTVPPTHVISNIPMIVISSDTQAISKDPSDTDDAFKITAHLEQQLEERTNALTAALKDLTKSKIQNSKLQEQIRSLESESMDYRRNSHMGPDRENDFEEKLRVATKERDEALKIVSEIKKLMSRN